MNQILFVDRPKKGNSLDIKTIIKIFVIIMLVLAVILIGKGIFSLISSNKNKTMAKPEVQILEESGKAQINITSSKAINKIVYSWNEEEEHTLQGRGQTQINEKIDIPVGTNTLNVKVIDIDNKEYTYQKEFFKEDNDLINPEIEFLIEGSKVKIVARDETELRYIMYRWDDEDNTTIEVREDSKTQIEEKIAILKGEHVLTVIAVDAEGNEQTKQQTFKGAKKPEIKVSQEGDELVIKITDEENIKKIELTVNGKFYSTDWQNTGASLNMKEVELKQKLDPGQNTVVITAYSVSGLSEQITANAQV